MTNEGHTTGAAERETRTRLETLHALGGDGALRRFSLWCAEGAAADARGALDEHVSRLRSAIDDVDALTRLFAQTSGAACAAGTIGVRNNPGYALAQLTVFSAANPDALRGALAASTNARGAYARRTRGDTRSRPDDAPGTSGAPGIPGTQTLGGALRALERAQREALESLGGSLALRAQIDELDSRIDALRAA